jgi:hypothetical protein
MIFGFTPPGSMALGIVVLPNPVNATNLLYLVSGQGWDVRGGLIFLRPGTMVDMNTPRWAFLADQDGPPIDAVALNQYTYDYMTNNNGVIGLGYPYWAVRYGSDVIPIAGDYGPFFKLGQSVLGGGHVLG